MSYLSQKESVLLDRINKAKLQLEALQKKQKLELGNLCCKYGLHLFELDHLSNAFKALAQELANENM